MSEKKSKYKITSSTIQKANSMLIRNGISEKTRRAYNGDINIQYNTKNGIVKKSFTNLDLKKPTRKHL